MAGPDAAGTTSANSKSKPNANGTLNGRDQSTVDAFHEPTQLYYRPGTNEMLWFQPSAAKDLDKHAKEINLAILQLREANDAVTLAIDAYSKAKTGKNPAETTKAAAAVEAAGEKLGKANEKAREAMKPLDKIGVGGSEIVELLPIYKSKTKLDADGKAKQLGKKVTYVHSDKLKRLKGHFEAAALSEAGEGSVLEKNADGKTKINGEKLKTQLKTNTYMSKAEVWKGYHAEGALGEWAENWNKDHAWKNKNNEKPGTSVDLSASAQLMRYSAGVGAHTEWNLMKGEAALKAEAKSEFLLAEAKAAMEIFLPDREGYSVCLTDKKGKTWPLGAFRLKIAADVSGSVGASASVEIGCEIKLEKKEEEKKEEKKEEEKPATPAYNPKKAALLQATPAPTPPSPVVQLTGTPSQKSKLFSMDPKEKILDLVGTRKAVVTPVKAEVGAFAGAKAEASITGAFQWKNPHDKPKPGEEVKFKDFVMISPGISGLAGAGLTGQFVITYENGAFHCVAELSACLGLGLKGKFEFTTNFVLIAEFVIWAFYQLYNTDFALLTNFNKGSFDVLKNIMFMAIHLDQEIGEFMYKKSLAGEAALRDSVYKSVTDIENKIQTLFSDFEKAEKRDALAAKINSGSKHLMHSPPETKAMLIYQLTRHGKVDWIDPDNYTNLHAFHDRKLAILQILFSVQTTSEWENIFQHISINGTKNDQSTNVQLVTDVLGLGGENWQAYMQTIPARLKDKPARGYPVMMNNTHDYGLYKDDHPNFDC